MRNRIFIALCLSIYCFSLVNSQKVTGITVVAPPKPIGIDAFERVGETFAQWVCLVPYGFLRENSTELRYNLPRQWWGETKEGLETSIKLAHKNCMKVMLKPQVYMHGSWVGDLDYEDELDWKSWERSYEAFFNFYLDIAITHNVDMFCIGTEFKIAVQKRPDFWKKLIAQARAKYKGKLVYSANWDEYELISFWKDLDYVGISSYFPLSNKANPQVNDLLAAWKPVTRKLENFSKKYKKPILFTEYGYQSIDQCAWRAWEVEKKVHQLEVNQEAQATAFRALYLSLAREDWWAGGFIWKWFPDGMGHEGFPEKDYTPQDKLAESIIATFFERM